MSVRAAAQGAQDAQPVPAWKRLGLKLKVVNQDPDSRDGASVPDRLVHGKNEAANRQDQTHPHKKRRTAADSTPPKPAVKVYKTTEPPRTQVNDGRPNKKVVFAPDTKDPKSTSIHQDRNGEKTKKVKQPRKVKLTPPSKQKSNDALHYLDQFLHSHGIWKFNKSREIWILKNAFSVELIPPAYDQALASYLQGLKGPAAKARLQETAETSIAEKEGIGSESEEVQKEPKGNPALPKSKGDSTPDGSHESLHSSDARRNRAAVILSALKQSESPTGEMVRPASPKASVKPLPSKSALKNGVKVKQARKLRTPIAADISSSSSAESSDSDDGGDVLVDKGHSNGSDSSDE